MAVLETGQHSRQGGLIKKLRARFKGSYETDHAIKKFLIIATFLWRYLPDSYLNIYQELMKHILNRLLQTNQNAKHTDNYLLLRMLKTGQHILSPPKVIQSIPKSTKC